MNEKLHKDYHCMQYPANTPDHIHVSGNALRMVVTGRRGAEFPPGPGLPLGPGSPLGPGAPLGPGPPSLLGGGPAGPLSANLPSGPADRTISSIPSNAIGPPSVYPNVIERKQDLLLLKEDHTIELGREAQFKANIAKGQVRFLYLYGLV